MKIVVAFFSLMSVSAFAGTFSSIDFSSLAEERAEVSVYKTKSPKTAVEDAIKNGMRQHSSSSCGKAIVTVGRKEALQQLEGYYNEYKIAAKLYDLMEKKKISSAVIVSDGEDGESESCSQATMEFHSVDGETLSLFFDYNT